MEETPRTTFADFGIPFPLFEAPVSDAADYAGIAVCRLCRASDRHCFDIGIGDALIVSCPACGVETGLSGGDRADAPCRACGHPVPFPESLRAKKQLLVCHACLRDGKAALTKGTEFGMVAWEQAFAGVTHGAPGLETDVFELVPIDPEEEWYGARIPGEHLWELLRTPAFHTWQEERWLFCCRQPMTYAGGWAHVRDTVRPEDPGAFFTGLFDANDPIEYRKDDDYVSGCPSLYVYRCPACRRHRATYDYD